MSEDEKTLIKKLYYTKGVSVPKIKQIPYFSHISMSTLYTIVNRGVNRSSRMQEVIELRMKGYSRVRIAEQLNISRRTVYNYIRLGEISGDIKY